MNNDDINDYVPSLLNPRRFRKLDGNFSLTQEHNLTNINKENFTNSSNVVTKDKPTPEKDLNSTLVKNSTKVDLNCKGIFDDLDFSNVDDIFETCNENPSGQSSQVISVFENGSQINKNNIISFKIHPAELQKETFVNNEVQKQCAADKPIVSLSFGAINCDRLDVSAKNTTIKRIVFTNIENDINVDCDIVENSQVSDNCEFDLDENMNEISLTREVSVNLEIKNIQSKDDMAGTDSKVLILNTNAIGKIGHVIVQPPNYKLVKRKILAENSKGNKRRLLNLEVNNASGALKQKSIDAFFPKISNVVSLKKPVGSTNEDVACNVGMNKNSSLADAVKRSPCKVNGKGNESPRSLKVVPTRRELISPKIRDTKTLKSQTSHVLSAKIRNESASAHSPRKESINFSSPSKCTSNRTSTSPRHIPDHKIVAGTHFAVDAFSYGEIPNVKHYFLTHFHSDHYTGLKKSFNKLLFCSKITAELCISRLSVNPKCIHVVNVNEGMRIDGVEVTAVDANHCPGAVMFVFVLANGKTLLHTGDFRASPVMESYPIFWNRDVHTIYLDTTYCNPRYDFPTQEQSLETALYILRQKKMDLEKAGKKFSTVLIVCGTYTIGKEKFFLGMARRVGCSVWACPEKDRVLQIVEGRSFSVSPPQCCQLHVVPMKDLTHEKLKIYLDSLQGAFTEVVAFKPSGWENGKNSCVEKDMVTIHGIPYSEHSSFSELIRFVKFLKPKQIVPTVDISGGVKAVQKYFSCPFVYKDEGHSQSRVTDYFSIQNRQQIPAVT